MSMEDRALKALSNNESGAAFEVLQTLAELVVDGKEIDPDFQKIVNAIVAQAVFSDGLPPKKKGRPESSEGLNGFSVAYRYFSLVDSGVRYTEAVAQVAAYFHKDERHIMRIVKKHKWEIGGDDPTERERKREWWKICDSVDEDLKKEAVSRGEEPWKSHLTMSLEDIVAEREKRNPILELHVMIEEVLRRKLSTDIK